jgi:hypothetical protein
MPFIKGIEASISTSHWAMSDRKEFFSTEHPETAAYKVRFVKGTAGKKYQCNVAINKDIDLGESNAIVLEYIVDGEPVGTKAISKAYLKHVKDEAVDMFKGALTVEAGTGQVQLRPLIWERMPENTTGTWLSFSLPV